MKRPSVRNISFVETMQTSMLPPTPVAPPLDGQQAAPSKKGSSRQGLKHIGGYFARGDVEKFAVLRARLGLDNSELIRMAIEEMHRKVAARAAYEEW